MCWRIKRLQWCWAHLKRDSQALIDHPDRKVKRLGHDSTIIAIGYGHSSNTRASNLRITRLSVPSVMRSSGASCRSAPKSPRAVVSWSECSPSWRPVACRIGTHLSSSPPPSKPIRPSRKRRHSFPPCERLPQSRPASRPVPSLTERPRVQRILRNRTTDKGAERCVWMFIRSKTESRKRPS